MLWWLLAVGCRTDDPPPPPDPVELVETEPAVYTDYTARPQFVGEPPRNLLMISIDTLRRDHLGRYGGAATPFLDDLAATGVALDDHVQCANWTFVSTSCTLAGRTPVEAGHMPRLTTPPIQLPEGQYLAMWLADAGFTPMLVSSNPWLSPIANNAQGHVRARAPQSPSRVAQVVDAGLELFDELTPDERWFLHLHVTEPHAPYTAPEAYLDAVNALAPLPFDLDTKDDHYETTDLWPTLPTADQALLESHLRARYAAEVQWLDDELAAGWDLLRSAGALDDTLVVVWTDHGEQFWERGQQSHAWSLHGEENDAVLLFWADNIAAEAWAGPTHAVDLVPTLLDLYGIERPADLTGIALGAARPERLRFTEVGARGGALQAVHRSGHVLHYHWGSGGLSLYDRNQDPTQLTNLRAEEPELTRELWQLLLPRVEAMEPLVTDLQRVAPEL